MQPGWTAVDPTNCAARRLGAASIEFGSTWLLGQVLSFAFQAGTTGFGPTPTTFDNSDLAAYMGGALLVSLVPYTYLFVITVVLRSMNGASLGQRLLGLVTVDESGQPVSWGASLARAGLGVVDGFPYCCYLFLVGGITMFVSPGHRRVADMVMHTYVVPKEHAGTPLGPPHMLGAVAGWGVPAAPLPPEWGSGATSGASDGPVWDAARNTHVRRDPATGIWYGWDAATNQWRAL